MYLKSIQLQKFLKVRKMWLCLRKKGGSWLVAITAIVICELVSDVQFCGDKQHWHLGQCSLLSHHQQMFSLMAAFEFGKKKKKLLFLDLKVNLIALFCFEYSAFPFLAIRLNGKQKCFKSPLLEESYECFFVQNKGVNNSMFCGNVANFSFFFLSNSSILVNSVYFQWV